MPNSQLYSVFLLKGNSSENAVFLFKFKQDPLLRPKVGDVLTNPLTFVEFKILRDQIPSPERTLIRITDDDAVRSTDNGDTRVLQIGNDPNLVTHQYFVTPANNPNRISSWSRSDFEEDQTLRQLFR